MVSSYSYLIWVLVNGVLIATISTFFNFKEL